VSPHATATPFNDPVEARVIAAVGGDPVVHPFKAQIGHTLGAAGALELLACLDAIERGVLPAAAGDGALDPEATVRLLDRTSRGAPQVALKLAAAFGGSNSALVLAASRGTPRAVRSAFVGRAVHVDGELAIEDLVATTGLAHARLERADGLVRCSLAAVARLRTAASLEGAGIVVGSALATVETNAQFAARIRARGARAAEPRRFPYTSPNAAAGECSIAFGLTGPGFAVGGGMHAGLEALATAALLVEAGDAERMVVVAVDEAGPLTRALGGQGLRTGAVAVLVGAGRDGAIARLGAMHVVRGSPAPPCVSPGHRALQPLVAAPGPQVLECSSPPDAIARITLEPL
jgi:3-oxoacyl-[acyl-carrier-protein] synthase II